MKTIITVFRYLTIIFLHLVIINGIEAQTIFYVDKDASGTANGSSWTNAYTTIYAAVAAVNTSGDQNIEIRIAKGTYLVSSSNNRSAWLNISAKTRVAIIGGYTANTTLPEERDLEGNVTIISGDIGTSDYSDDNTYHVIKYDGGSGNIMGLELNGVTITRGRSDGTSEEAYGGGVYVKGNASLFVKDCIFKQNYGNSFVALYYNQNSTYASRTSICSIYDSQLNNNISTGDGIVSILSKKSIIDDVIFNNNQTSGSGGGVKVSVHSMSIENVLFKDNSANISGGSLDIEAGTIDIKNTLFNNNTSPLGSAIKISDVEASVDVSIINSVFTKHNISDGLIHITDDSGISGAPTCNIGNSIIWGNTGTVSVKSTSGLVPTITYSAVQGGGTTNGNINTDPLFTDYSNNNFYPQTTSPVINKGSNALLGGLNVDFNEQSRIKGSVVDMGIYETDGAYPAITTHPANTTITANQVLNLSVVCTGVDLSYQWYKDNTILYGETNSTLSVTGANSDHAGVYKVNITSSIVDLESNNATVTINLIPLTVEAKSETYKYGDDINPFELKPISYPAGTSSAMFDTQPSVSCSATKTSIPGSYPLVVSSGTSKYFDITAVDGQHH